MCVMSRSARKTGPRSPSTSLFQSNTVYWLHQLDLTPDLNTIFSTFHKASIQRKIRRAEREGLTCNMAGPNSFWMLFAD